MLRRWGLFFLINIIIMVILTTILNFFGIDRYTAGYGVNTDYMSLAIFCLVWGMGGAFISLGISRWMAKKMMRVQLVDERGQYGAIVRKVHEYARRSGIEKMPEVGVYDSPDVNAFATGPTKNRSLVAVSTGLLQVMSEDEIDGVLGHEVTHISNGDMVTMTLLQGVMNAFVMFAARVIAIAINNAMKSDRDSKGLGPFAYFGVVIVLQIAFGFLAQFVVSWFSRFREYRADEGGAKLAGKEKMRSALQKLQHVYGKVPMTSNSDVTAAMKISSKKSLLALLSTHPPLEDRIRAVR